MGWLSRILIFALIMVRPALALEGNALSSMEALPPSVKSVYETLCPPDYWVANKRELSGSTFDSFPDIDVYLMVCGSAASSMPYVVILNSRSGIAKEAQIDWTLNGRDYRQDGLENVRFGFELATLESSFHVSASCEPTYKHRWNGAAFQLIAVSRKGCKKSEMRL